MYIAMNRFSVASGHEDVFEKVWRERERFLDEVPGFQQFKLLRGAAGEETTTFISHSIWKDEAAFRGWTESEAFRKAHGDARTPKGTLTGHPVFEGYEVVLEA